MGLPRTQEIPVWEANSIELGRSASLLVSSPETPLRVIQGSLR